MAKDELRPDIAAAKARIPTTLGSGRELKKLESHLAPDESVLALASGRYGRDQGLLTLTERRLLFTVDGMMGKARSEDFPLGRVSSVQWQSGMIFGSITIMTGGNEAKIEQVASQAGKAFVEAARGQISAPGPVTQPAPAQAAPDVAEQIRKLGDLHAAGILTDEEFTTKKSDLLSRI